VTDVSTGTEPDSHREPCGWSSLEFYAYIVRNVGIPKSFRLVGDEWVAEAPFTKPTAATLAELEKHGV
jgi:hypothetical protein